MPSPSVSGFTGSVPILISCKDVIRMKLFIATIFIITIILLGDCVVNSNHEDFDDETIRKAEESVKCELLTT